MDKILCLVLLYFNFANSKITAPTIALNDGRSIPSIALGTWLGNGTGGRIEAHDTEVENAVAWAIDAGYRHIDTAYIYGVEDQVGRGIARKIDDGTVTREEVFVTTKLWNDCHERDAVVPALRKSLKNLNLEYVDLYLIHWPVSQYSNFSLSLVDYLDTWKGMIEARNLGLTKSIGLSNFNIDMMNRIKDNGLETPAVLQVEINLNLQQPDLLAYCKQHNIAVAAYTPFGSLFYSKARAEAPPPRIDDPALVRIAEKYNKTVPQVALRYLLDLGVIPLPKSLTKSRIEQNIDVFDFQLSQDEKNLLKSYDKGYRCIPQYKWLDHPYYPFAKS